MHPAEWASPELGTRRLVSAAAEWVRAHAEWDVFASLTFRRRRPEPICADAFREWLRFAARDLADAHVPVFWVVGPQASGTLHYHALLELPGADAAGRRTLQRMWSRNGFASVQSSTGRPAKYVLSHHTDWGINVACPRHLPCRRRAGCVQAPSGSWP